MIELQHHQEQKIILTTDFNMDSNKIFIGRFQNKVSKAGNDYMTFSLSPEDFEKLNQAKWKDGWVNLMVGKSQKTGLPYLSYTPRQDLPPISKSIHDSAPF